MFFILAGAGELRFGPERFGVRAGDVIACPPGGAEVAHQLINTSATEELRFLAVSTQQSPEVAEYPDSGKFGVLAEGMRFIGRVGDGLDYWEGNE